MKRGEVWWVNFPAPAGRRPAVLVSRNQAYPIRNHVTVVPLTRTGRHIPTQIPLGPEDGVPKSSVANADDIATVPKGMVADYLCVLSTSKMQALEKAIKFALDLR